MNQRHGGPTCHPDGGVVFVLGGRYRLGFAVRRNHVLLMGNYWPARWGSVGTAGYRR